MTETEALTDGEPMPSHVAPASVPSVGLLAGQPAAVIGSIVVIADGVLASAVPLPEWLTLTLGAVIAVAGILGIRSRVTPVAAPKLDSSTPLTP